MVVLQGIGHATAEGRARILALGVSTSQASRIVSPAAVLAAGRRDPTLGELVTSASDDDVAAWNVLLRTLVLPPPGADPLVLSARLYWVKSGEEIRSRGPAQTTLVLSQRRLPRLPEAIPVIVTPDGKAHAEDEARAAVVEKAWGTISGEHLESPPRRSDPGWVVFTHERDAERIRAVRDVRRFLFSFFRRSGAPT